MATWGYPFGSLLLFETGHKEFSLIDGLQRSNTLRKYYLRPNLMFGPDEVDPTLCETILHFAGLEASEAQLMSVSQIISDWIRSKAGLEEVHGYSTQELIEELELKLGFKYDRSAPAADMKAKILAFLNSVKRKADISKKEIPVMIYSGRESDLPNIFERINSKGSALNKYQVFAASWAKHTFKIADSQVVAHIRERYEAAMRNGFQVENYPGHMTNDTEFSLFEYLFGLGKLLTIKYPHLFGRYEQGKADVADSIVFNLVTASCGLALDAMAQLPDEVKKVGIDTLQARLIEAITYVDKTLTPFIGVQANRGTHQPVYHTDLQILSMIALVYRLRHYAPWASKWSDLDPVLQRTLPYYYLHDIITEYWKGTGDHKLKEIVITHGPVSRYFRPIKKSQWRTTLSQWFANQLSVTEKRRASPKAEYILFLKYLHGPTVTYRDNFKDYHADHVIPVKRLLEAIPSSDPGWPINCVGNLALLEKSLNVKKKDMTLVEYFWQQVVSGKL